MPLVHNIDHEKYIGVKLKIMYNYKELVDQLMEY